MKTETQKKAGRVVVMAAVAALGAGALVSPALAIQDDGRMVEENALLLHGQIAGFGENGFYVDPGAIIGLFKAPYILFHKALIAPVQLLGNASSLFPREGYREQ